MRYHKHFRSYMPLYQAIVLAIVQGLTEFLPVSSSAHLALVPWLFGWKDPGLAFDIALHAGTLLSILLYFFRDWFQILMNGLGVRSRGGDPELQRNRMLLWLIALATIPVGIAGLLFGKQAEGVLRTPYIIGTMLILVGVVMGIADRALGTRQGRGIGHINLIDAITIGLGQALAIVPGTSRSGITITTGLFRGLDRYTAARFSFLMSTPAIAAAALKAAHDLKKAGGLPPDMRAPFIVGFLVSGLVGALVIGWFLNYLQRFTLRFFVAYRIVFGIIVLALAYFFRYNPAE